MKKSVLLFACSLLVMQMAFGQSKLLTLEDASYMNRSLFPSSMSNLLWRGDDNTFAFVDENCLVSGSVTSSARDTILRLIDLNNSFKAMGMEELKRFPSVKWVTEDIFQFSAGNVIYRYDLGQRQMKEMNKYPEEAGNIDFDNSLNRAAYTIDNNLWIAIAGRQIQVTYDENKGIVNGHTVHRNEFGITKGTFWSPKGKFLAFYRMDETMVSDYPLVDITARIAQVDNEKYPMAGMTSHQVTLGIFDIEKNSTTFIKTGEPADQYLTCVTWDPGEKFIYIALLNRDQNHMKLNKYDVSTGDYIATLFEEQNPKYVEPEHPLYFLKTKPDHFVWLSERDGYQHLYLYKTDGTLVKQLTRGPWVVTRHLGTDEKENYVFFSATKESPLNNDIYKVSLHDGIITRLSHAPGTHNATFDRSGRYFIDIYNDTTTVRDYLIVSSKGKVEQFLLQADDPLQDYNIGKTEVFKITRDSLDLYCSMIKPPDFDPTKKYPVIVSVYGGPHAQLVTNTWNGGSNYFDLYLAQKGYIIFTLDNRGSSNRGLRFEQAIHRNLGTLEVEDQVAGVEYLKTLPYVDSNRIGVTGWSYGGFMTISLMLKKPDIFKVGVCGGPVTDWKYYEVMYGERYMDTPESNPEGYAAASLLNHAGNLKGDLLIIHGTFDDVVVWQHSLALIQKFIEEGKQVDYFVYPGHGHGVGGKDRLHLNRKMELYFDENL